MQAHPTDGDKVNPCVGARRRDVGNDDQCHYVGLIDAVLPCTTMSQRWQPACITKLPLLDLNTLEENDEPFAGESLTKSEKLAVPNVGR